MDVRASNGTEGYLLYRRMCISELFKDNYSTASDFVEYADITLDLKVYGFASHMYWLILTSMPRKVYDDREITAYFLYCLDKLGDKKLIENFKGNFPKEFKKIENLCQKQMEESVIYKSFINKE